MPVPNVWRRCSSYLPVWRRKLLQGTHLHPGLEILENRLTPVVVINGVFGTVWLDSDNDGTFDGTEVGVAGAVAELLQDVNNTPADFSDDVSIGTRVTASNGNYLFTGLAAGSNYSVYFRPPVSNPPEAFAFTSGADSDVNPSTGRTASFSISTNSVDLDAGLNGLTQQFPTFGWVARANSTGSFELAASVALDSTGNVYVTGEVQGTVDFDPGPGTYLLNAGSGNIFVAKYTPVGALVWARMAAGGTSANMGNDLDVDGNGNVYITGWFQGTVDFDPDPSATHLQTSSASGGSASSFAWKLNSEGKFVWVRSFNSNDTVRPLTLDLDGNANVYLAGEFNGGTVDFDAGNPGGEITAPFSAYYVAKLDRDGNFILAKSFNAISGSFGGFINGDIKADDAGNIYATGGFSGSADFDPSDPPDAGDTFSDSVFVVRLNANGSLAWIRTASTAIANGTGLCLDGSGNIYAVGTFSGTTDFDPGPGSASLTAPGQFDAYVWQLTTTGDFGFARQLGTGALGTFPHDVALNSQGDLVVAGAFYGTGDFDPGADTFTLASGNSSDLFVVSLTSTGEFQSAFHLGSSSIDEAYGVALDANYIYLAGRVDGTVDFDPSGGTFNLSTTGGRDVFVAKLLPPPTAPVVTISSTDPTADENAASPGNQGAWTLTRNGDTTGPLTVRLDISLSGASVSDYVLSAGAGTSGGITVIDSDTIDITFAAGSANAIIVLTAANDLQAENDESVTLTVLDLAAYDLGSPSSATVTITENDFVITISATDPTADENAANPGNQAAWTLTRSGDTTGTLTVRLDISLSGASAADYSLSAGAGTSGGITVIDSDTIDITFAAGSANAIIVLTAANDLQAENDESVTLTLVDLAAYDLGSPASDTVTITENDFTIPLVTMVAIDPSADENAASPGNQGAWTLTRGGDTTGTLTVQLEVSLLGASVSDYVLNAGAGTSGGISFVDSDTIEVTFAAGSASAIIVLTATSDPQAESDESVILTLVDLDVYDLGSPSSDSVTITQNDLLIAVGAGFEGLPRVRVFDSLSKAVLFDFQAYDKPFEDGVRLAVGDVTGDGVADIVTGPRIGPSRIQVFDGATGQPWALLSDGFLAFPATQAFGADVAVGQFDADTELEIVAGMGRYGPPRVRVFDVSGGTVQRLAGPLGSFRAYGSGFVGGVRVSTVNYDGTGFDEIITAPGDGGGGAGRVKVFADQAGQLRRLLSFQPFGPNYQGAVFAVMADIDGTPGLEIVTSRGQSGSPQVRIFDQAGTSRIDSFLAYDADFKGGVKLDLFDRDGDGDVDTIVTGQGRGGQGEVRLFDGLTRGQIDQFFAFGPNFDRPINVAG